MTDMQTIELPTERMIARIEGAIGWMIFNNPVRRNAVSLDMWAAVPTILDRFEADPAVRVIVLRGEGDKAFVAGADISQFEQQRSSRETVAHYDATSKAAGERLERTEKPTIAMIRGYCIGGGMGMLDRAGDDATSDRRGIVDKAERLVESWASKPGTGITRAEGGDYEVDVADFEKFVGKHTDLEAAIGITDVNNVTLELEQGRDSGLEL